MLFMENLFIPSIIAKNQAEYLERFNKISSCFDMIQLDIMDNKFVNNKSLMFDFPTLKSKKYEAHLMINNPLIWAKKNYMKVDILIAHVESFKNKKEIISFLNFVKLKKKKVGLALNSKTSINSIKFFIPKFDLILLMTGCPGKDGTKFLHSSYKKIKRLRKISQEIIIEVDGGVNNKNIKKLKNSGANHFVIGSYFQECKNVSLNLKRLKKLVN